VRKQRSPDREIGAFGFMGTAINGERIEIARDEQLTREYDKMTAGRIKPSTCNF